MIDDVDAEARAEIIQLRAQIKRLREQNYCTMCGAILNEGELERLRADNKLMQTAYIEVWDKAVAAERERCAKLVEKFADGPWLLEIVRRIREGE
jgi:hypothetical protein